MMKRKLSGLDRVSQARFPTVMVPRTSELLPCELNQTRLLMACNGLYIQARRPWGELVRKLWDCPRQSPLPYGEVAERDDFTGVFVQHVLPVLEGMLEDAARFAEQDKEWAGFIVFNGEEFMPWEEEFLSTAARVEFLSTGAWNLPEGLSLVADVHSHGDGRPFFSRHDNRSDRGLVKISITLGNYRREKDRHIFDYAVRYCVEGFFFDCPAAQQTTEEVLDEKDCATLQALFFR